MSIWKSKKLLHKIFLSQLVKCQKKSPLVSLVDSFKFRIESLYPHFLSFPVLASDWLSNIRVQFGWAKRNSKKKFTIWPSKFLSFHKSLVNIQYKEMNLKICSKISKAFTIALLYWYLLQDLNILFIYHLTLKKN